MFRDVVRSSRTAAWLVGFGFVCAILTFVIQRINVRILDESLTSARQGQLDAARVLLAVSDAISIIVTTGIIIGGLAAIGGFIFLVRTGLLLRRARRTPPKNPADAVSGTVQIFGDLIDLLRRVYDDLAERATAVETAEKRQVENQALQSLTPEQATAVRSQLSGHVTPQLARGTRWTIIGIVLSIVLLVVAHYWK